MKHLPVNRRNSKSSTKKETEESFAPDIYADSLEVMESYCLQKIILLQSSLEKLNIMDDAKEIIAVCQLIKNEKKTLLQIINKKNQSGDNIC